MGDDGSPRAATNSREPASGADTAYRFILRGRLGAILEASFSLESLVERGGDTEMVMEVEDDAQLYGVLDRLERLGIGIISFEETAEPTTDTSSAGTADPR